MDNAKAKSIEKYLQCGQQIFFFWALPLARSFAYL